VKRWNRGRVEDTRKYARIEGPKVRKEGCKVRMEKAGEEREERRWEVMIERGG